VRPWPRRVRWPYTVSRRLRSPLSHPSLLRPPPLPFRSVFPLALVSHRLLFHSLTVRALVTLLRCKSVPSFPSFREKGILQFSIRTHYYPLVFSMLYICIRRTRWPMREIPTWKITRKPHQSDNLKFVLYENPEDFQAIFQRYLTKMFNISNANTIRTISYACETYAS